MFKCKVCGEEFELKCEAHYVARDCERVGLVALAGGTEESLYDVFDCPHCGCQNVVQKRKRYYFTTDFSSVQARDLISEAVTEKEAGLCCEADA